jgi:guanylate kinase
MTRKAKLFGASIEKLISTTTKAPRKKEQNDENYFLVDLETFKK